MHKIIECKIFYNDTRQVVINNTNNNNFIRIQSVQNYFTVYSIKNYVSEIPVIARRGMPLMKARGAVSLNLKMFLLVPS